MASLKQSEQARQAMENDSGNILSTMLCDIADSRLYRIVKWCKSLPLFKNITVSWPTR